MKSLQELPFYEQLLDIWKRCDELLPKSPVKRTVLLAASAGVIVYLITKKRYRLPPGPRGWPILGNVLEFKEGTMYDKLIEWKKKYGPVILFRAGPVTMVTLNSAEVLHEAFVKKGDDFAGRPKSYSLSLMSDGYRNISLVDYTPTWKFHRKLATQALRKYLSGRRVEESVESSLKHGFELMKKQTNPFNPKDALSLIVFNIINKMCFNFTVEEKDEYFVNIMDWLDPDKIDIGNGFLEDFFPPLRLFPSRKIRLVMDLMEKWIALMGEQVRQHRETFSADNIRDFCDAMLLAQKDAQETENPELTSRVTDRHLIQTMMDVFGAGIDSSRATLLWSLKYLAGYPEVQKKVHQELDQVLGSRRFPKLSDRPNLSYTEAVLYEVMRIASFGTLTIPHTTTCDTTVGGYEIPKGTMILGNMYAVHHDPEIWEEPEVFRPERFLDQNGKLAPKNKGWVPFSAGKRMCLGESVSKPELHLLLAGIMKEFKVSPPTGVTLTYESTGQSFLYYPKAYELVFESRS